MRKIMREQNGDDPSMPGNAYASHLVKGFAGCVEPLVTQLSGVACTVSSPILQQTTMLDAVQIAFLDT